MDFKELNDIVTNKLNNQPSLAQDSFELARKFNLRVKNSAECKQDFPKKNPLLNNGAIYALYKGEYTIYYDEKYAYKNFAIAHEIAHHLLQHESDGATQHHDANILAAMLIAPKQSVLKNKIKNEVELSEKYIIPIKVAQSYWECLNIKKKPKYWLYILLIILLTATITIAGLLTNQRENSANIEESNNAPINSSAEVKYEDAAPTINNSNLIYVTVSGTKYHKPNCFHIKNKTNTIELSIEKAVASGYEPCKDCIK